MLVSDRVTYHQYWPSAGAPVHTHTRVPFEIVDCVSHSGWNEVLKTKVSGPSSYVAHLHSGNPVGCGHKGVGEGLGVAGTVGGGVTKTTSVGSTAVVAVGSAVLVAVAAVLTSHDQTRFIPGLNVYQRCVQRAARTLSLSCPLSKCADSLSSSRIEMDVGYQAHIYGFPTLVDAYG